MTDNQTYANTYEELAMLYMRHQNLTGKTPTEIHQMFRSAYDEILKAEKVHVDGTAEYV